MLTRADWRVRYGRFETSAETGCSLATPIAFTSSGKDRLPGGKETIPGRPVEIFDRLSKIY
jgi:hypothetical protein